MFTKIQTKQYLLSLIRVVHCVSLLFLFIKWLLLILFMILCTANCYSSHLIVDEYHSQSEQDPTEQHAHWEQHQQSFSKMLSSYHRSPSLSPIKPVAQELWYGMDEDREVPPTCVHQEQEDAQYCCLQSGRGDGDKRHEQDTEPGLRWNRQLILHTDCRV